MYIKYRSYAVDASTTTTQKVKFTDYANNVFGESEKRYWVDDPYFETLLEIWDHQVEEFYNDAMEPVLP